jgi:D-glycero-beta-D-manno-heptose-7-phosphate kinase
MNCVKQLVAQNKPDVIIFQDYNKGVLTAEVIENITSLALNSGISVAVDPKKKNFYGL